MQITILDAYTMTHGRLSLDAFRELGEVRAFDRTPAELTIQRAAGSEIVLTNKTIIDGPVMDQLPALKFISVMATGYNAVDIEAARQRGIIVSNVRGYSTFSVAQHVFALLFAVTNKIAEHNSHVKSGGWSANPDWSYTLGPTTELQGKTLGIYGLGKIGNKVADIGLALGMRVLAHHKHPERDARPGVSFVDFDELLKNSDVLSLHAPLSRQNQGIINRRGLALMKPDAILINTGRGGLLVEQDLVEALRSKTIAAACLDVMEQEPPPAGHPLFSLDNCIITPHNAWVTKEARQRLLNESVENVRAFIKGQPRNVVS
ncbi:MAG: D-2-hydroxyacid dehydrogenase [Saprospiraceae bacterium]